MLLLKSKQCSYGPVTEKFLSFVWKYKLFEPDSLVLDGERIDVVSPGEVNSDSGPDFFNAKLKIGKTLWAGNVEVHVKSSDWNRHGHDTNHAFSNVILHIADEIDQPVYSSKGEIVPTVKLHFNKQFLANYEQLIEQDLWIPCSNRLGQVDDIVVTSWLSKLGISRLESRTIKLIANMEKTVNDWEEVFYQHLARSFGFHVNAEPFEALAKATPFKIVRKYRNDILLLEALFFGQAGLLSDDFSTDDYYNKLRMEYHFLQKKHSLKHIEAHLWKFMRIRPGNFPTVRIAQFAAFINRNPSFFSLMLDAEHVQSVVDLLRIDVSVYWLNHYTFANATRSIAKPLGDESAHVLIINTIVPFYFVYGKVHGLLQFQDKALRFLELIDAEQNSIIDRWRQLGITPQHAFDTQALLELKNEFCDKKRCLECGIGVKIIGSK